MFGLGTKFLGWVGFVGSLAALAVEHAAVVGDTVADGARVVFLFATALGGAILRPTTQRKTDP